MEPMDLSGRLLVAELTADGRELLVPKQGAGDKESK